MALRSALGPVGRDRPEWVRLPTCPSPRATVIVTGLRSAPFLLACLRSLAAHRSTVPFEVVLALNEPTPALQSALDASVEGAHVVACAANLGFGGICNRAAQDSRAEYLVILNDDAEVQQGWLSSLVDTADADPTVGAVGSVNLNPDGTLQQAGAILWANGLTTTVSEDTLAMLEGRFDVNAVRRVDYCGASSLLVRHSTWLAVGGFDEVYYPAYFEDVDLCLRIAALGQSVVCQPRSRIVHHRGTSSSLDFQEFLASENRGVFLRRWADLLPQLEAFAPEDADRVLRSIERAANGSAGGPTAGHRLPASSHATSSIDTDQAGSAASVNEELAAVRRDLAVARSYSSHLESKLAQVRGVVRQLSESSSSLQAELAQRSNELAQAQDALSALGKEVQELQGMVRAYRHRKSVRLADKIAAVIRGGSDGGVTRRRSPEH